MNKLIEILRCESVPQINRLIDAEYDIYSDIKEVKRDLADKLAPDYDLLVTDDIAEITMRNLNNQSISHDTLQIIKELGKNDINAVPNSQDDNKRDAIQESINRVTRDLRLALLDENGMSTDDIEEFVRKSLIEEFEKFRTKQ